MDKRNDRRGGFYWRDNRPYVSVTNILKVLDKPALRYWFGQQVYYAMVEDPTLNEQKALSAPYNKSDTAKSRGTTIHSFVEGYRQGMDIEKVVATMPPNLRGYGQAFLKWVNDNHIEFVEHERTVFSDQHLFAGTADFRCMMNHKPDIWLIDAKSGKNIYPEVELQLSAYKQGYLENKEKVDRLGVLLLETGSNDEATGNYVFAEKNDQLDIFLATKKLWEWQNRSLLNKIRYFERG